MKRGSEVIARLAAANPVPTAAALPDAQSLRVRPRPGALAAALAAAAVAIPAAAFADDIRDVFSFSNQGANVAANATGLTKASDLNEAMQELGFPSTLQLLGERDGIRFYAAKLSKGEFCFAVESARGKGVGCDLTASFPSPRRPIIDFSRFSHGERLAGFAADGVARVGLTNADGATIASTPVIDNVYADVNPPTGAAGVAAFDAHGTVIYRRTFDQAP